MKSMATRAAVEAALQSPSLIRTLQQEPSSFVSCADGNPDHVCQNGGRCVASDETDQYYCDCSTATQNTRRLDSLHYVGQWCHLAPEIFCYNDGQQQELDATAVDAVAPVPSDGENSTIVNFCVNGGQCTWETTATPNTTTTATGTNSSDISTASCQCADDFVGLHCEYHPNEVVTPEQLQPMPVQGPIADSDGEEEEQSDSDTNSGSSSTMIDGVNSGTSADNMKIPCGPVDGQNFCHHGTECIRTLDGQYACDCTRTASPTTVSSDNSILLAGRWCEYQATSICDDSNQPLRPHFCVNQGTCVSASESQDGIAHCECDESTWTGSSCEVSVLSTNSNMNDADNNSNIQDGMNLRNCQTQCLNGGQCRKGANDQGRFPSSSFSSNSNGESEYCDCAEGFTGPRCEHSYVECGNGELYCLHGTTCVPPSISADSKTNTGWSCGCQEPFQEDQKYGEGFCQQQQTTMCTTKESETSVFDPRSSLVYCRNGGTCTEFVENGQNKVGCDCPPGWTGAHCELYDSNRLDQLIGPNNGSGNKTEESAAFIFLGLVMGVIFATILLFLGLRWNGRQAQQKVKEQAIIEEVLASMDPHLQKQTLVHLSFTEEADGDTDFDEIYLEDVELL